MGFSYQSAIGELIYALVTYRPDISYSTIKMSQYSNNLARCHYIAIKNIFRYLRNTINIGLTYWRNAIHSDLPVINAPVPVTPHHEWQTNLDNSVHVSPLYGMIDSDWAADKTHHRSVTGFVYILAGATFLYKTRFQQTVAMSSTEAEFVAALDAGKMALYLLTLLDDLHIPQKHATLLYEDNMGAYKMVSAGQPTPRTCHIDIWYFALLDWVETDLLDIQHISTMLNSADILTKNTTRILFHQHADVLMGKMRPHYLQQIAQVFTRHIFLNNNHTRT